MKHLQDIIGEINPLEIKGSLEREISGIYLSSKEIKNDSLFVALTGDKVDGHNFISDAIANGAVVIIHDKELIAYHTEVTYIRVASAHEAIGYIAHAYYDFPTEKLKLIGVTGTNGKTTVTTLLHQLYRKMDWRAGLIGTVCIKINDQTQDAERTTPDSITLNKILSRMADHGCEYVFMEASSHSIDQKRIAGLSFAGGVFTNLTHDHIDYHKTFENYAEAKKKFFDSLDSNAFALSNMDDKYGSFMLKDTKAKKYFYSLDKENTLHDNADFTEKLEHKLIGHFNDYNVLACFGAAVLCDEDRNKVKKYITELSPVVGRFQYFKTKNNITCIVDYAHTPDALLNVLNTTNDLREDKKQKIITVVGCGGDRDKTKRPIMAKIAYDMSDIVILTSDNPRTENPDEITKDMIVGLESFDKKQLAQKVKVIPDRHEAIKQACFTAVDGDFIMVAGKGHETYQEIDGIKNHFDDMEELSKYFMI